MSKIICDVCGTTYADSATQCPICGCVRPANAVSADGAIDESVASRRENYTYVKGGRFSKKNVKKRNQNLVRETKQVPVMENREDEERDDGGKGLVIAIVVLLIAVIAVASYITVRFFLPIDQKPSQDLTPATTTVATTEAEEETTVETTEELTVNTEITLDQSEITLDKKDAEYTLVVTTNPADTTDAITFNSENDAIATIDHTGKIVAIGEGETNIIVTCGEATVQFKVICKFNAEESGNADSSFSAPYQLNKSDVSIRVGESFRLYLRDANGESVPVAFEIQKPGVCTMDENTVTGAASGTTKISVSYNGETYSCIVRVR